MAERPSAGFAIIRRATQVLLAAILCAVAATAGWSEPPRNAETGLERRTGFLRRPSRCEMRPSRAVEVTEVAPNALSKARAVSEALADGLSPSEAGALPAAADNSTSIYFPPVRAQTLGDCTCWSSGYYWNTYTQARDEELNAASDNPDVICSPRFIFSLICEGHYGAECTEHVMSRLSDVGCSNITLHPLNKDYRQWPTEAAWVQALQNRTGTPHKIRADTSAGIEAIKQHIANGNCLVTRGVLGNNFQYYPDNSVVGIDNRVWYWKNVSELWYRHSLCVVGYDDNRSYVDHRDGMTHYGAFLIVNSEGPSWGWYNSTGTGSKGFFWISYTMFLEGLFGWYDDSWPWVDPCYDNAPYPEMYYNDDRPLYRPPLYAVAGINHDERNKLIFTGGIGPTGSADFTGPQAIEQTDEGDLAVSDSDRVAVDLSDGTAFIPPGVAKQLFVELVVDGSSGSTATMTSADFYHDLDDDGTYETLSSTDPTVTVPPDTTGYATAVLTTFPINVYVDDSNTSGPWDGSLDHPFQTIQEGVDAASAIDTVWVFPGTYNEQVMVTRGVSLIGAGPAGTIIDAQSAGSALLIVGAMDALVEGFTLTGGGPSYTAMASVSSTATLRDCVATGSRSGFGASVAGTLALENCLSFGHTKQGVWANGSASITAGNMTIFGNGDNGVMRWGTGAVTLANSILWGNVDDVDGEGITASHCDIGDGDFAGSNGNFSLNPLFVTGLHHNYYLSQTAAGQGADSPCVDAGSDTAASFGLDGKTTRTDNVPDTGVVDIGYHAERPLWITDVYWDQATTSVVLTFTSVVGVDYVVETAEADAYADGLTWSDLMPVTAAGLLTTVSDSLATNPLGAAYRFYRVKRTDALTCTRQTAAVHELDLSVGFAMREFFVSTPLEPDPDHAAVEDVLSTQLDYTNVKFDKLAADSGLYTRATYAPGVGWANTFLVAAGEGYMLDVGDALPQPHTLRLTGTVPEAPLEVSVTRASYAVSQRWMAYSMPRSTTLGALGLETAITPSWDPANEVRLLPRGTTVWKRYFWDGADWREGSLGGPVADTAPIACCDGILFIHNGVPGEPNTLTWPTWYVQPPNM